MDVKLPTLALYNPVQFCLAIPCLSENCSAWIMGAQSCVFTAPQQKAALRRKPFKYLSSTLSKEISHLKGSWGQRKEEWKEGAKET